MGSLIVIFSFVLGVIFLGQRYKYKNKLIERGLCSKDVNKSTGFGKETLRLGLVFVGIAFGFILGEILIAVGLFSYYPELSYVASVFFCGGIALVVGYAIENKDKDSQKPMD